MAKSECDDIRSLNAASGPRRLRFGRRHRRLFGATRPSAAGFEVHELPTNAAHWLYALLSEDDSNSAHGRSNALVRRLGSFERAAGRAISG